MKVSIRKYPFPYIAAVAICSDIDETKTLKRFWQIQEFCNTTKTIKGKRGVGLNIGNSFFMYDKGDFSYFNSKENAKGIIKAIKCSYIDSLHTYGNDCNKRKHAEEALNELFNKGIKIQVWINHQKAPVNIGKNLVSNLGDVKGTQYYHTDITIKYGFRFFWLGNITRIMGQTGKLKLKNIIAIFDIKCPVRSFVCLIKECVKILLGKIGIKKYKFFRSNELIDITSLRDGNKVYEFKRFCNYPFNDNLYGSSHSLAYLISKKNLKILKENRGSSIIYTHLGKNFDENTILPSATISALRNLKKMNEKEEIFVTTTETMLNYFLLRKSLRYSTKFFNNNLLKIYIDRVDDEIIGTYFPKRRDLKGISFVIPECTKVQVFFNNNCIPIKINPKDIDGRFSITIK